MIRNNKKQSLGALFWPIFFELFLVTLVSVIDTAMVSSVGDNSVGAVGASTAYLYLANNVMTVVSIGASAIMSRLVGAGQNAGAVRTCKISCVFNFAVGGIFSLIFGFFTEDILTMVGTDSEIYVEAVDYLRYVGISCVLVSVNFVLTAYMRSFGRPKLSFVSATVGNVFNIALNAVFIKLGYGTLGVALATLISRAVTLLLSFIFSIAIRVEKQENESVAPIKVLMRSVLDIGLPAAGESFIWTFCNSVNMSFINMMSADAVNTYSYVIQITGMLSCIVNAFAQSTSILVGWRIGSRENEAALRIALKAGKIGEICCVAATVVMIPITPLILSLMTDNSSIITLSIPIMAIHLVRIFGQLGNNVYGQAIKTAGDARFILIIGLFIMPFWVFVGSYLLGIVLNWGIIGYWIGASMDEFTRCFIMKARWKSKKWEKHCLSANQ